LFVTACLLISYTVLIFVLRNRPWGWLYKENRYRWSAPIFYFANPGKQASLTGLDCFLPRQSGIGSGLWGSLQRKPVPLARYHFFIPQIHGSKLPSQDWIASSPAKAGSEAAFGVAYKENRYRWPQWDLELVVFPQGLD